jgi:hypothetical protein
MAYREMSLKVCEGCGTLWVREARGKGVYCRPCAGILRHFPDPTTRIRTGRKQKDRSGDGFGAQTLQACGGAR